MAGENFVNCDLAAAVNKCWNVDSAVECLLWLLRKTKMLMKCLVILDRTKSTVEPITDIAFQLFIALSTALYCRNVYYTAVTLPHRSTGDNTAVSCAMRLVTGRAVLGITISDRVCSTAHRQNGSHLGCCIQLSEAAGYDIITTASPEKFSNM